MSGSTARGQAVGRSPLRVWALPSEERLERQFLRAGAVSADAAAERVALLRADWVYDDAIVRGLLRADADVALVADGECIAVNVPTARALDVTAALVAGEVPPLLKPVGASDVADGYNDALRKREPPYLMRLTRDALQAIEKRVFGGAYKGVTDLVTLYLWPAPARVVTRWCALAGITPNQVTTASLVLVLLAMWAFWQGEYGWGLLAAWPMTFLDTVDGKLARVTVSSTRWGNVFDHGIDLIHPPFWWWAWIVGLPAAGFATDLAPLALSVIIAGYLLQRIEEGIFIAAFRMEMHVWTRFDSRFRLITARRNPNLLILSAAVLAGRPDLGILAVAAWVALCLAIHALRIVQAAWARRSGPLQSWLAA
jgi:phosphatidylglycerophosphate synthase